MEMIYVKSEKGVQELDGHRTLSLKQRHILIMTDGRRPKSYFKKMFNSYDIETELTNLEKLGFISKKGASHHKTSKQQATDTPTTKDIFDDLTTEHLSKVKYFLIRHLQQEVGVLGRNLVNKLELTTTKEGLKSYLSEWHMEIRNSRNGKRRADTIVGELNHLLANPDTPELSDSDQFETAH